MTRKGIVRRLRAKIFGIDFYSMIKPAEFAERWKQEIAVTDVQSDDCKLLTASQEQVCDRKLTLSCSQFLIEAGLPSNCAPFLTFKKVEKGLPRLWDVYSPGSWQSFEKKRVLQYVMIGSDGAGNAVCLDESAECQVIMVDHETLFGRSGVWRKRNMPRIQYINKSVPQLAESLLTYALFGRKLSELGYTSISEAIPIGPLEWLENELRRIDEVAILKDAFWYYELWGLKQDLE